ncbi:hypothetical protein IGL98_002842 [Enterococcus sp. DIV0840]
MYLLLVALGIISLIHSLLLIFIMQKNTELTKKVAQLERRNSSSKSTIKRQFTPNKEKSKFDKFSNERETKPMKRGSR